MEVIDQGLAPVVVRNPEDAILIVTSVIPKLSFASNMGIIRVDDSTPGKWIVYLHPGTNLITFMAEGYKSVSSVRLVVPKKKVHTVEVKPLKNYGVLMVESNPPGARIFLDGEDTGEQTPYFFDNLKVGPHLVVLKIDDYQRDTTRVNVKPEVVLRISLALQAVGYLTLNTTPSGAEVVIDSGTEEAITVRTPVEQLALKTGVHVLSGHNVGYPLLIEKEVITIERGKTVRKHLDLLAELRRAKFQCLKQVEGRWAFSGDGKLAYPGWLSGLLFNGLGGLVPSSWIFGDKIGAPYRLAGVIDVVLALSMWANVAEWYANTKEDPTISEDERTIFNRIPKEGKEDDASSATNRCLAFWAGSIIVGGIADMIAYSHDKENSEQLWREIQELEEQLQPYSLHYDPVKNAFMVQYVFMW
jgi:hypothetical protein